MNPNDFYNFPFTPKPKSSLEDLIKILGTPSTGRKTLLSGLQETSPPKTAPSFSDSLVRVKTDLSRATTCDITDGRGLPAADTLGLAEGRKLKAAILYCDIRGFTSAVFNNPNRKMLLVLDAFVSEMARITADFNGSLVDCAGDRIMSVFARPHNDSTAKPIQEAVVCAFWMQTIVQKVLNAHLTEKRLPNINCGVGIDYGSVVVGRVGIRNKNKLVVLGNPANFAAKLEDKAAPGEVNVSKIVFENRPEHMKTRAEWVFTPKPTILTVEYYSCNLIYLGPTAPTA